MEAVHITHRLGDHPGWYLLYKVSYFKRKKEGIGGGGNVHTLGVWRGSERRLLWVRVLYCRPAYSTRIMAKRVHVEYSDVTPEECIEMSCKYPIGFAVWLPSALIFPQVCMSHRHPS